METRHFPFEANNSWYIFLNSIDHDVQMQPKVFKTKKLNLLHYCQSLTTVHSKFKAFLIQDNQMVK